MVSIFHVPVGHLYVFLGEMSIRVFAYFSVGLGFFAVNCINCLYILEIKPLLVASLATIFFPLVYFCFYFYCLERSTKSFLKAYFLEFLSWLSRNESD